MIPRAITFDEIKPGDRIRFEWPDGDRIIAYTGIADQLLGAWWCTPKGDYLAYRGCTDVAITLLDRPTPPLPQALGTPIMVYRYRTTNGLECETERVMIRDGFGWRDLASERYTDDQILSWAPLTPGDRIDR